MKSKKNPSANLENYRKLFVQLGLVLALALVYFLIENKTYKKNVQPLTYQSIDILDHINPIVDIKIKKPKPKIKKVIKPTIIEKVNNDKDVVDVVIQNTDIDEDTAITIDDIDNVKVDEPINDDEVPFIALEYSPVFPGCVGTNKEKKACFEQKIKKFIYKKFNTDIASDIGLTTGIQKIYTVFKIDKNGTIVDIKTRASHKALQKEALRVLQQLPKMQPGRQNNHPVTVKYSIPIVFKVE